MMGLVWFLGVFVWIVCGLIAQALCCEYQINGSRWTWEELVWFDVLCAALCGGLMLVMVLLVWGGSVKVFPRGRNGKSNTNNEERF
jgi:hypothetical protein